jgi:hypothetical protein
MGSCTDSNMCYRQGSKTDSTADSNSSNRSVCSSPDSMNNTDDTVRCGI